MHAYTRRHSHNHSNTLDHDQNHNHAGTYHDADADIWTSGGAPNPNMTDISAQELIRTLIPPL